GAPGAGKAGSVRAEAPGRDELRGNVGGNGRADPYVEDAGASGPRSPAGGPEGVPMTHDLDPRIHGALDGELDRAALTAEERALVERLDAAARSLSGTPVVPGLSRRVMVIFRRPLASPVARFRRWLTSPQPVTLSLRPVYSLVIAA